MKRQVRQTGNDRYRKRRTRTLYQMRIPGLRWRLAEEHRRTYPVPSGVPPPNLQHIQNPRHTVDWDTDVSPTASFSGAHGIPAHGPLGRANQLHENKNWYRHWHSCLLDRPPPNVNFKVTEAWPSQNSQPASWRIYSRRRTRELGTQESLSEV